MSSRMELLEELALRYLTMGNKLGFSPDEIVQAVSNLAISKFQQEDLIQKLESEEDLYYRLFKEKLKQNAPNCDLPKEDILKKGLIIMYVIHQKKYTDLNSFIELALDKLELKNVGSSILGTVPYSGIIYIIRQNMEYSNWTIMRRSERLKQLEEIEKIWFAKFKEEFENEAGHG